MTPFGRKLTEFVEADRNPFAADEKCFEALEGLHREYVEATGNNQGTNPWTGFTSTEYPYSSSAPPPTCLESCWHCAEQYVPVKARMFPGLSPIIYHDDETAFIIIADLIADIESNLADAQRCIETYGSVIAKRWLKWTPKRREELLRKTTLNLFPKKYADLETLFEMMHSVRAGMHTRPTTNRREHYEDVHLIPYLDIPSLIEDWFAFDRTQLQAKFYCGEFKTAYNPHCVVARGKDFGKVVQWREDSAHREDMIGYPCSRHVFQAQQKIAAFIRSAVNLILEGDLRDVSTGRTLWGELVASSFRSQNTLVFQSACSNQPFSPPPKFDAHHALKIITSRQRIALDEVVQLQLDPIYFRHAVVEAIGPSRKKRSDIEKSISLGHEVAGEAFVRLLSWTCLLGSAEQLVETHEAHAVDFGPMRALPSDYLESLSDLEESLRAELESMISCIESKNHVTFQSNRRTSVANGSTNDMTNDPLFWNLRELSNSTGRIHGGGLSFHISCVDDILCTATDKERSRVSQSLYDLLSDVAAIGEVLHAINYHPSRERPRWRSLQITDDAQLSVSLVLRGCFAKAFKPDSADLERIRGPTSSLLSLPLPGSDVPCRQDMDRVKVLQSTLQRYWHEFSSIAHDTLVTNGRMTVEQADAVVRILRLTSGERYESALKDWERKMIDAIERKEAALKSQRGGLEDDATAWSTRLETPALEQEFAALNITHKTKIKTQPPTTSSSATTENSAQPLSTDTLSSPQGTAGISVTAKSLQLFRNMFVPADTKRGRTKWEDFVAAMVDAGFSATHTGGSAGTFEHDNEGSIVVHRPHPDSTLDPIKLQSIGKRLTKWFGWDEDAFAEREKEKV